MRTAGILHTITGRVHEPLLIWCDNTKRCAYHFEVARHDKKDFLTLKVNIEELIKEGTIQLPGAPPNVNNNPLLNYGDANINMITTDEDWNLEGTIVPVGDMEKNRSSAFIAHVITVQVRAPTEVEVLPSKPRIVDVVGQTPPFNTKAVPWKYQSDVGNKEKARLVMEVVAV